MIKVISVKRTCTACPSQWECKVEDGRMLYVRFRWGSLTISISAEPTNDVSDAVNGEEVFYWGEGDELDGWMEFSRLKELTKEVIEWPEDYKEDRLLF